MTKARMEKFLKLGSGELSKLADLVKKATGFADVLGRVYVERVFTEIERLRVVLTDLTDATRTRGAMLELDLDDEGDDE